MRSRHTLVWLRTHAHWHAMQPQQARRLQRWFDAGYPAIIARRDGSEPAHRLRLGIPLPPDEHKQRLGVLVAASQIARSAPPPHLADIITTAPPTWHRALHLLVRQAAAHALHPRAFGSVAWQALTGLPYVHADSDVDLLWSVHNPGHAATVVRMLRGWEAQTGLQADGELILPDHCAVNWREYDSDQTQVLVKCNAGCELRERMRLFVPHAMNATPAALVLAARHGHATRVHDARAGHAGDMP